MPSGYHADIDPDATWAAIAGGEGLLIDVRTAAEWTYVGLPDLGAAGERLLTVEWQHFPSGQNHDFAAMLGALLRAAGAGPATPLYFICRSGARSASAAAAMSASGFTRCFNVAGGFEGGKDADGHRGHVDGWKAAGLPWQQG